MKEQKFKVILKLHHRTIQVKFDEGTFFVCNFEEITRSGMLLFLKWNSNWYFVKSIRNHLLRFRAFRVIVLFFSRKVSFPKFMISQNTWKHWQFFQKTRIDQIFYYFFGDTRNFLLLKVFMIWFLLVYLFLILNYVFSSWRCRQGDQTRGKTYGPVVV